MSVFNVTHSYRQLPAVCFADTRPTPVANPSFLAFNSLLAQQLHLPEEYWNTQQGLALFSGNQLPQWVQPLAQAYAGHQFANYVPRLGDGRALLLAEIIDHQKQIKDLQLKGSGPTPFSRGGDGRSPLGPVIREYLVSEAMHALGVPTTRALAAVSSGEWVFRDEALPGAILTRVASSHIRIGTFQYAANQSDPQVIRALADYVIVRHYPQANHTDNPYLSLLESVISKQAELVAQWMSFGFIHGVMNTDNMSISGETIDYGPCAFMEAYNPAQVYSFIDRQGRYAYKNQPAVAQWNLARLAESLLSLIAPEQQDAIELVMAKLNDFPARYQAAYLQRFSNKLGFHADPSSAAEDKALIQGFLQLLTNHAADFTQSFYDLSLPGHPYLSTTLGADFSDWYRNWQQRLATSSTAPQTLLQQNNPYLIPRNHLVQRVIEQVSQDGDLTLFNQLATLWQQPYQASEQASAFHAGANRHEQVCQTFCGT